jgi:predicted nucleotidyltransferase
MIRLGGNAAQKMGALLKLWEYCHYFARPEARMDFHNPINAIVPSLDGEVYRVLAHTTAALTGSRIATLTRRGSNSGVRVVLNRLVRQGLVLEQRAGGAILYRANREHVLWPAVEQLVTTTDEALSMVEQRISDVVTEHFMNENERSVTLAFYGSVARRDSNADSDIDIVAVFPDSVRPDDIQHVVDALTETIDGQTGNETNIYALRDRELSDLALREDPLLDSWSRDSRTFYGPELRDRAGFPSRAVQKRA